MEDLVIRLHGRDMLETSAKQMFESSKQLVMGCPSRTRSVSAFKVWKSLSGRPKGRSVASSCVTPTIREECLSEADPDCQDRRFSSFDSTASLLVLDRVMSLPDVSTPTSGRCSAAISPPFSPPREFKDDLIKLFRAKNALCPLITSRENCPPKSSASLVNSPVSGARTVGRWLKDRREKKKEETRVQNAQLHAAVSVASAAAAVAAVAAATAAASSSSGRKNEEMAKMDMAVASAAALVAAQCVEAAKAMGADKGHLASVVSSAVNVRMHDDVTTLTAAAATALRGAATLKARGSKCERNSAAVAPADRGIDIGLSGRAAAWNSHSAGSGEIPSMDIIQVQDYLANGTELLKRTRKGDLRRKIISVYINGAGQVILKTKSRHIAGTVTKTDENIIIDVCKDIPTQPGRHLFDEVRQRHHFALKTAAQRVIEFGCRDRHEYEIWTHGVSSLLSATAGMKCAASH